MNILLLGPGQSRNRFQSDVPFGTDPSENLWVIEYNSKYRSKWPDARFFERDLMRPHTIDLPEEYFNEIHAYEVLNLLPGSISDFFAFWRWIWDILAPGGRVYVTVPHWKSQWIYAYPGPQRVYTSGLLLYLDNNVKIDAKESFDTLWPMPYNFESVGSWEMLGNGSEQGFAFILKKV